MGTGDACPCGLERHGADTLFVAAVGRKARRLASGGQPVHSERPRAQHAPAALPAAEKALLHKEHTLTREASAAAAAAAARRARRARHAGSRAARYHHAGGGEEWRKGGEELARHGHLRRRLGQLIAQRLDARRRALDARPRAVEAATRRLCERLHRAQVRLVTVEQCRVLMREVEVAVEVVDLCQQEQQQASRMITHGFEGSRPAHCTHVISARSRPDVGHVHTRIFSHHQTTSSDAVQMRHSPASFRRRGARPMWPRAAAPPSRDVT